MAHPCAAALAGSARSNVRQLGMNKFHSGIDWPGASGLQKTLNPRPRQSYAQTLAAAGKFIRARINSVLA